MIGTKSRPKGAGRAAGSPLGNSANNSSGDNRSARRDTRYVRRGAAQTVTSLDRLRDCGRAAYGSTVSLRLSDGHAGVAGVMTCGSVWACSVCSAKIAARRHDELTRGIAAHRAAGGRIAMLTLTMRHRKGHRLATLWDALSDSWAGVTSGRQWVAEKRLYGLAGFVRVVELTHTKRGWHVHIHALLLLNPAEDVLGPELTEHDLVNWKQAICGRWGKRLEKHGLTQLDDVQDLRFMGEGEDDLEDAGFLADYLTKAVDNGDAVPGDVAAEFAMGAHKTGKRDDSRTPFGILDDLIRYGDAEDARLWWEYEAASRGRRQMTWSKGLRDALGLGDEKSDEDIADEEEGTKEDDVLILSASDWFEISYGGYLIGPILHELEVHGVAACEALIFDLGFTCQRVVHD